MTCSDCQEIVYAFYCPLILFPPLNNRLKCYCKALADKKITPSYVSPKVCTSQWTSIQSEKPF